MTIEKTHHAQNPVNVAILNYVAEVDQASYQALFDKFADLQISEVKAHLRFSKKMEYLCFTQQLCSRGRGHDRVFSLGPEAGKAGNSRGFAGNYAAHVARVRSKAAAAAQVAPAAAPTTPKDSPLAICLRDAEARDAPAFALSPSRLTVTVLPTRSPALRPGALDFKSVASRGFAC